MGLVDYSDSDESEEASGPPTKKQKKISNAPINAAAKDALPPLPSAFHDLYASTVRVSASDDPTLHQGRRRVNPHKVGHWPSHLYIEWHPTPAEQTTLISLLTNIESNLISSSFSHSSLISSSTPSHPLSITSFLTSDLGAPQPLHISLSRPIVLSTSQKDAFLSDLESSIRTSGLAPFELAPTGLEWHRTEESARSFLVLRVRSAGRGTATPTPTATLTSPLSSPPPLPTTATTTPYKHKRKQSNDVDSDNIIDSKIKAGGKERETRATAADDDDDDDEDGNKPANPQLSSLLRRANALVTAYGQPALYAFESDKKSAKSTMNDVPAADDAFHISIAWSFAEPTAELRRLTEEAFLASRPKVDGAGVSTPPSPIRDAVRAMRVRVEGIKAKIGNVVTHIPLPDARSRRGEGRGLFGI
ncbi:U6 snRNA phosphodiesterase Usb1 [Xylaria sp. FL0064]|nr:U6 snRNA phosphodiesterase Usb1 [Xylaria sp. FL0064]